MTALEKEVLSLPKHLKISMMEQIWSNLSQDAANIDIPDWHIRELEKTEEKIKEGTESFLDWNRVKKNTRDA